MKTYLILLLFCLLPFNGFSQDKNTDQRIEQINEHFEKLTKLRKLKKNLDQAFMFDKCSNENIGCYSCNKESYLKFMKSYFEIYELYDTSTVKKCMVLQEKGKLRTIGARLTDNYKFWTLSKTDKKLEKGMYRSYKKWIRRLNNHGIKVLLDSSINPLSYSKVEMVEFPG